MLLFGTSRAGEKAGIQDNKKAGFGARQTVSYGCDRCLQFEKMNVPKTILLVAFLLRIKDSRPINGFVKIIVERRRIDDGPLKVHR